MFLFFIHLLNNLQTSMHVATAEFSFPIFAKNLGALLISVTCVAMMVYLSTKCANCNYKA